MPSPFFCPRLEQRGNGPAVVGNERQPLGGSFQQAGGIFLAQEVTILPFRHPMHDQRTVATFETICQFGRDMFIQKKLEHLSFSSAWWKRIRSPSLTDANGGVFPVGLYLISPIQVN